MKIIRYLSVGLALFSICLTAYSTKTSLSTKPNIVIILTDDLGNNDLGYRGGKVKTPTIDTLANQSMQLQDHYGLPVCTPARAALMTGRHPMRYGLQTLVIFPSHTYGLPTDEKTIPELLKKAGYQTAMVGKWHLGHAHEKYWPQKRGFDHFYGNLLGEVDYFTKKRGGIIDWQRNGTFLKDETYYTKAIGKEAVKIINNHDEKKPLFLYVSELAPHSPYEVPRDAEKIYPDLKEDNRKKYSTMISLVDEQVKKIISALKSKNMLDNTIIIFSSDNGGATNPKFASGAANNESSQSSGHLESGEKPPADNAVFRGGKGSLYEGGVRVPTFVYWPKHIKPGVLNEPTQHVDILPTLLYLAGIQTVDNKPLDGKNLWPLLTNEQTTLNRNILINVEQFRGAVRKGKWKLVKLALLPGKTELFDLEKDPGERNNVAQENPKVVQELEKILMGYAKQQAPSKWLKAQPQFFKYQGKTILDPDFDIGDGGLPHEKAKFPERK